MYFSTVAVAIAAVVPLANAHGSGLPQILGLDLADLKNRDLLNSLKARISGLDHVHSEPAKQARASPLECGEGIGSCPAGKCCSRANCTTTSHTSTCELCY